MLHNLVEHADEVSKLNLLLCQGIFLAKEMEKGSSSNEPVIKDDHNLPTGRFSLWG